MAKYRAKKMRDIYSQKSLTEKEVQVFVVIFGVCVCVCVCVYV